MPGKMTDTATLIRLLRQMSHDMRTPLGALTSTSEMLVGGVYGTLTPQQARAQERIGRNSRRLLAILNDFVTYVKAEMGNLELSQERFDPRKSLTAWCSEVCPSAEEKGLAFNLTMMERVPACLVGDKIAISQIILALLWNAVAFTAHGNISIESDWLESNQWVVTVTDSGTGISSEDTAHIFEPFWRGQTRPQVPTAGVGLSLAVALALTKIMNGQLFLKQTGPEGSAFCVQLPLLLTN
jgi:signal transduction histidine kinase